MGDTPASAAAEGGAGPQGEAAASAGQTGAGGTSAVGATAELYLGNILFALERCAMAFDDEDRREEAAFYRGIARKLAEARGRDRPAG